MKKYLILIIFLGTLLIYALEAKGQTENPCPQGHVLLATIVEEAPQIFDTTWQEKVWWWSLDLERCTRERVYRTKKYDLSFETSTLTTTHLCRDTSSFQRKVVDTPQIDSCKCEVKVIVEQNQNPCDSCCQVPKQDWGILYPGIGIRSTYDSDIWSEEWFFRGGYRHHWRDTTEKASTYAGIEIDLMMKSRDRVPCDTCGFFTDQNYLKPAVRSEIFVGREFGIPRDKGNEGTSPFRGYIELRYSILQPEVLPDLNDRTFLPKKTGVNSRFGIRTDVGPVQVQAAFEVDVLATCINDNLIAGGELSVIIPLDFDEFRATSVQRKQHRDSIVSAKAARRDSMTSIQQARRDSIIAIEDSLFIIETDSIITFAHDELEVANSRESSIKNEYPRRKQLLETAAKVNASLMAFQTKEQAVAFRKAWKNYKKAETRYQKWQAKQQKKKAKKSTPKQ